MQNRFRFARERGCILWEREQVPAFALFDLCFHKAKGLPCVRWLLR